MIQSEEALLRISENNQSSDIFQGKGIKDACQEHVLDKGEHVTVAVISKCVDALQEYAQVTRNGLVGSIDAEKEFVRHYAKALEQIKKLGDVASIWDVAQSDQDRALHFLLGDANVTGSLAVQLRRQNGTTRHES